MSRIDVRAAITEAHREKWARVVASLTRRFGDLDIAEDAAAEAFAAAVERWPADGVPPGPGTWLTGIGTQAPSFRAGSVPEPARVRQSMSPALALAPISS